MPGTRLEDDTHYRGRAPAGSRIGDAEARTVSRGRALIARPARSGHGRAR